MDVQAASVVPLPPPLAGPGMGLGLSSGSAPVAEQPRGEMRPVGERALDPNAPSLDIRVLRGQVSSTAILADSLEEAEGLDKVSKAFQYGSSFLYEILDQFPQTSEAADSFLALAKGISAGRKLCEVAKMTGDVTYIIKNGEKGDYLEISRHTTWFFSHSMTLLNWLGKGVINFGPASGGMNEAGVACALMGFTINTACDSVKMHEVRQRENRLLRDKAAIPAAGRSPSEQRNLARIDAELNGEVSDAKFKYSVSLAKNILTFIGLAGATFVIWYLPTKYHMPRWSSSGLQFIAAGLGAYQAWDHFKEKIAKQQLAANTCAVAAVAA